MWNSTLVWKTPSLRRVASVVAACLVLGGCAKAAPPAEPKPPAVATTRATFGTIAPVENLPGLIAPSQSVAVQSTLVEPADAVNVQEGDRVTKGEVLAVLDTADLSAQLNADLAQANSDGASASHTVYAGNLSISQGNDAVKNDVAAVAEARATLQRDQTDYRRYTSLLSSGYIAEQQAAQQQILVHNDQEAVKSAIATLASAQSNVQANGTLGTDGLQATSVEQARATQQVALAQADQIRTSISKATIVSPIDGVVVNRNLNVGEYPGTRQLFTLQATDPVFAILRGSGSQIAQLQTGAAASVVASDLSRSKLSGVVAGILNQINPGSTDFQVKVRLANPRFRLRPGMAVVGSVDVAPVRGVRIPTTAFTDDSHDQVLTVDADGTVHSKTVVEVASAGTNAVVSGLSNGARVVSDGQTSLGDGQKVALR